MDSNIDCLEGKWIVSKSYSALVINGPEMFDCNMSSFFSEHTRENGQ